MEAGMTGQCYVCRASWNDPSPVCRVAWDEDTHVPSSFDQFAAQRCHRVMPREMLRVIPKESAEMSLANDAVASLRDWVPFYCSL